MKEDFFKQLIIKKMIAFMLIISMIFSSSSYIFAANNDGTIEEDIDGKIERDLYKEFDKNDKVSFLIVMQEEDFIKSAKKKMQLSSVHKLPKLEQEKRWNKYLVMSLEEESKRSQASLLDYLQKEKERGNVDKYKSFFIINSISVKATLEVAKNIANFPRVKSIVLDRVYKLPPLEERKASLENMRTISQTPWNLKAISQDKVLEQGIDGRGVVVGIIDSGVDLNHPSLKEGWRGNEDGMAIYSWLDLNDHGKSNVPIDEKGHGSHVCGIIAGRKDSQGNNIGVAPAAKWIAARVFDEEGASQSKLIEAGQWMLAPIGPDGKPKPEYAPDIINCSWGGNADNGFYREILKKWRIAGIIPVFSAGNVSYLNPGGEGSIGEPANFPEAFTVGAIRQDERIAKFSLRGPSKYADVKPDVSAPGVNIRSAMPGGGYQLMSGTSMACPHVAGSLALLKQAKKDASPEELERILRETAIPLKDERYVNHPNSAYGYGKINIYNALVKLREGQEGLGVFKGHIYKRGNDLDKPQVNHVPIKKMFLPTYDDADAIITSVEAQISDDNGIKSASLYIRKEENAQWQSIGMDLISGDKIKGRYSGSILSGQIKNLTSLQYMIEAIDINSNKTQTPIYDVEISSGITIGYKQDFEENHDGFEFGGKTPMWEWGVPTSGPMKAASGEKCLGTRLNGSYKGLVDAIVVPPVIDLRDNREAVLTFKHYYDMGNWNYATYETAEIWIAEAKNDNSPLDYKLYKSFKNSINDWEEVYVDLSSYKGKQIYIMFGVRGSLYADQGEAGWYIDDIEIKEASGDIPARPENFRFDRYRPTGEIEFECDKSDNQAVTEYCLYRSSQESGPFELVASLKANKVGNYYPPSITDAPIPQKGSYYYYMTLKAGSKEGGPSTILSHTFTEGSPVIEVDFEDGDGDFTSTGSATGIKWTYGEPRPFSSDDYNKKPSNKKGKNEGDRLWATELDDYRKANSTYILESPNYDISNIKNGRLYYQNWFDSRGRKGLIEEWGNYTNYDEDQGFVYFSKDGGATWDEVFRMDSDSLANANSDGQYRAISNWYTECIEIDQKYQTDQFRIKYELQTGSDNEKGGWFIDDIMITADQNSSPIIIDQIEPFALNNMTSWPIQLADTSQAGSGKIPLTGQILIEETGDLVRAEAGSGEFRIELPRGTYTVRASHPGFRSEIAQIELTSDSTTRDFILEEAGKCGLKFDLKDTSGKPIKGARISLVNPSGSKETLSDEDGSSSLEDLFEGDYILYIFADGYEQVEREIKLDSGGKDLGTIVLKGLIQEGVTREIFYDDGSPEAYLNSLKDGKIVGVRMENDGPVIIEYIKFMFGDSRTNTSEGKDFTYAIYEKNQFDGLAGRRILGPKTAKAGKAGQWTRIDLDQSLVVDGDFYLAYGQVGDNDKSALLAIDENSEGINHNVRMANGAWYLAEEKGAYMIRAGVRNFKLEEVLIESIKADKTDLKVKENIKVIDYLRASQIKVEISYSNQTSKLISMEEFLRQAPKISLDGELVDGESIFTPSKNKLKFEKDGKSFEMDLEVEKIKPDLVKKGLEDLIADRGQVIKGVKYSKSSKEYKDAYDKAIKDGESLLSKEDKDLSQEEIDLAIAAIKEAKARLNGSNATSGGSTGNSTGGSAIATPNQTSKPKETIINKETNQKPKDKDKKESEQEETSPKKEISFVDIEAGAWYEQAVNYVQDRGLMKGVSTTTFEPKANTNRAMFITILYRMQDRPQTSKKTTFKDVALDAYYADAVAWASENKIVAGYGAREFGPDDLVTRDQLVTFLYRYAVLLNLDTSKKAKLDGFKDASEISPYAKEAMEWAFENGIIKGMGDDRLAPRNPATRAEVSMMVMRFCQNFIK